MGLQIGNGITVAGAVNIVFEFPQAPINTVLPVVTGNTVRNSTLTTTTGTWTGVPIDFTYNYQWQRNTSNISGATSSTYVLANADVGSTIRSLVIATNASGNGQAFSLPTATILPQVPGAPTGVTATSLNSTSATVNWTPPVDDGGGTITSYTITATRVNGVGVVTAIVAGPTTGVISGLVTGGLYTMSVAATNAGGTGPAGTAFADIYIVPAIGENYGGGIVISTTIVSATVVSTPTGSGTTNATWASANSFCNSLSLNGFTDWVMPSRTILQTMFTQRALLSMTAGTYWSSTAWTTPGYYYVRTFPGGVEGVQDGTIPAYVRAVRTAFY